MLSVEDAEIGPRGEWRPEWCIAHQRLLLTHFYSANPRERDFQIQITHIMPHIKILVTLTPETITCSSSPQSPTPTTITALFGIVGFISAMLAEMRERAFG